MNVPVDIFPYSSELSQFETLALPPIKQGVKQQFSYCIRNRGHCPKSQLHRSIVRKNIAPELVDTESMESLVSQKHRSWLLLPHAAKYLWALQTSQHIMPKVQLKSLFQVI